MPTKKKNKQVATNKEKSLMFVGNEMADCCSDIWDTLMKHCLSVSMMYGCLETVKMELMSDIESKRIPNKQNKCLECEEDIQIDAMPSTNKCDNVAMYT